MEIKRLAEVRRANTRCLVALHFQDNKSELAREYQKVSGQQNPTPNLFGDLLRKDSQKPFGEKIARRIEQAAKLKSGQLDIPNSPLEIDERLVDHTEAELQAVMDDLTAAEKRDLIDAAKHILGRRKRRARV